MKLYSFFNSSTSYRVRIALALKGLEYDYQGINIRVGEQRSHHYSELNPSKGVPVLEGDDGFSLSQSLAIISYLDDICPEPRLVPAEPKLKARVLEVASAIAADMHPINNLRVLGYLTKELDVSDEQKRDWYRHWVAEGFTALEERLARHGYGDFCFGETPTLADVCLVPQVANAQRFGCDLSAYPRIMAVYEHCCRQAAFQQAEPSRQPDFAA
ncbi:glutathione-S-transferase [Marinobacterium nitratireducens]|uniref:Glutathione-S-transferase n=1 Tax=Marinobacterium nitratireducens TaxID=518897 RepID=A0A918DRE1_9GAMM|nr:maleylacetoacetate isomerase [Marinobacterium nitratireducens]GGO79948.1 glutathione-S-transferase [Marinobacterium nitratireducens]